MNRMPKILVWACVAALSLRLSNVVVPRMVPMSNEEKVAIWAAIAAMYGAARFTWRDRR